MTRIPFKQAVQIALRRDEHVFVGRLGLVEWGVHCDGSAGGAGGTVWAQPAGGRLFRVGAGRRTRMSALEVPVRCDLDFPRATVCLGDKAQKSQEPGKGVWLIVVRASRTPGTKGHGGLYLSNPLHFAHCCLDIVLNTSFHPPGNPVTPLYRCGN